MKMVTVRELKAQWTSIERRAREGESILVLNRGQPSARIVPPGPRKVLRWDNHLQTAAEGRGRTGAETVRADRDGRW